MFVITRNLKFENLIIQTKTRTLSASESDIEMNNGNTRNVPSKVYDSLQAAWTNRQSASPELNANR